MSSGWQNVTPREEYRERIAALEADLRAAIERAERAEAELAEAADLANSWARETSVAEARDGSGLRDLIDRLWGKLSGQYHALRAELAEARRQLEEHPDTRRLKALMSHPWAIGKCDTRFHPKPYCVIETTWINSSDREEIGVAYGDSAEEAIDAAIAALEKPNA